VAPDDAPPHVHTISSMCTEFTHSFIFYSFKTYMRMDVNDNQDAGMGAYFSVGRRVKAVSVWEIWGWAI
jgi:hypothetical protein